MCGRGESWGDCRRAGVEGQLAAAQSGCVAVKKTCCTIGRRVPGFMLSLLKQTINTGQADMPLFIINFARLDRSVLRSILRWAFRRHTRVLA